jgi:hypothetical protein
VFKFHRALEFHFASNNSVTVAMSFRKLYYVTSFLGFKVCLELFVAAVTTGGRFTAETAAWQLHETPRISLLLTNYIIFSIFLSPIVKSAYTFRKQKGSNDVII